MKKKDIGYPGTPVAFTVTTIPLAHVGLSGKFILGIHIQMLYSKNKGVI